MIINKYLVYALLGVIAISLAVGAYDHFKSPDVGKTYTQAKDHPKVEGIEKKTIPVNSLKVYDKEKAVKKLKLPQHIAENPNKQITAATSVPAYDGDTTVVAVTDTGTGNTEMQIRQEPVSPLKILHQFQVGLSYSPFHSDDIGDYSLDASYSAIRVLGVTGQVRGEVDSKANWKAAVRAFVEF